MSALDTTTGELVEPMSADAARRLDARILSAEAAAAANEPEGDVW